jgi:hypothetical protein
LNRNSDCEVNYLKSDIELLLIFSQSYLAKICEFLSPMSVAFLKIDIEDEAKF